MPEADGLALGKVTFVCTCKRIQRLATPFIACLVACAATLCAANAGHATDLEFDKESLGPIAPTRPTSIKAPLTKSPIDPLTPIQLTLVDPEAHIFGTFQSHNQKVVANANGIFITYIHYIGDPETTNIWRLAQSTDGGLTFHTVYEGHFGSRAPAIETDENNNIYLAFPDWTEGNGRFYFMRLLASESYSIPRLTSVTGAYCAAKHAMAYDPMRERFYIATQYGAMFTMGKSGNVIAGVHNVWQPGPTGYPQYPNLHVDVDGNLYFAETNVDNATYTVYRGIHAIKSADGGATWSRLDNSPVTIPVAVDETGNNTMISELSELSDQTWLCNSITKGGRTHFFYAQRPSGITAIPYMNYDTATGSRQNWQDLRLAGEQVHFNMFDGFFATSDYTADSPLYAIMSMTDGRMGCLRSPDNGAHWYDYAVGDAAHFAYATGGARMISENGLIVGTYTAATGPDGEQQVWFLRIETGDTFADADGDGLPDVWENQHGLNPLDSADQDGAEGDPDNDHVTNLDEYYNDTNPGKEDTDGDSHSDFVEISLGTNPNDAATSVPAATPAGLAILIVAIAAASAAFAIRNIVPYHNNRS